MSLGSFVYVEYYGRGKKVKCSVCGRECASVIVIADTPLCRSCLRELLETLIELHRGREVEPTLIPSNTIK